MTDTNNVIAINNDTDIHLASEKLRIIESQMNSVLFERRDVIHSMFLAYLANEHILLLGNPGVGKSYLADLFAHYMAGGSWFDILMSKSTTIDELFGLVMLSEFKKDNWKRKFSGYAPSAKIWFLDEIFKCNSQTLNGTLKAINERIIRNGEETVSIPLEMVIAASNEYPEDKSLDALYDRFCVRHWVDDLQDDDNMDKIWQIDNCLVTAPDTSATISQDEIKMLKQAVSDFCMNQNELNILRSIRIACREAGFSASTRTWRKAQKLVKANAVMAGRVRLIPSDFLILVEMIWKRHTDRPALFTVIGNASDPYGSRALAIIDGIRKAVTEIPSFNLLKAGSISKVDFINRLASVQSMLSSENAKIADIEDIGVNNPQVIEARTQWNDAKSAVDTAMNKAIMHR